MKGVKCIKCDISVSEVPYVPKCPIGGNHEFPNISSMPEQDNWKETFQNKFVAHITSSPGNIEHDRAVIFFEDIVKIEAFIEELLSSQTHALKE